jgi:hypothetical protein
MHHRDVMQRGGEAQFAGCTATMCVTRGDAGPGAKACENCERAYAPERQQPDDRKAEVNPTPQRKEDRGRRTARKRRAERRACVRIRVSRWGRRERKRAIAAWRLRRPSVRYNTRAEPIRRFARAKWRLVWPVLLCEPGENGVLAARGLKRETSFGRSPMPCAHSEWPHRPRPRLQRPGCHAFSQITSSSCEAHPPADDLHAARRPLPGAATSRERGAVEVAESEARRPMQTSRLRYWLRGCTSKGPAELSAGHAGLFATSTPGHADILQQESWSASKRPGMSRASIKLTEWMQASR